MLQNIYQYRVSRILKIWLTVSFICIFSSDACKLYLEFTKYHNHTYIVIIKLSPYTEQVLRFLITNKNVIGLNWTRERILPEQVINITQPEQVLGVDWTRGRILPEQVINITQPEQVLGLNWTWGRILPEQVPGLLWMRWRIVGIYA